MSAAAAPAAMSVLNHLRRLGHHVVGIDASIAAAPIGHAFCDEFFLSPRADSVDYLPFLADRLGEVDIFFPFIDEELLTIAEGWNVIPPSLSARIAVSSPEVLRDCVDKCRFQDLCESRGLPIAPRADEAPAIFKPRFGRGGRGIIPLDEPALMAAVRHRDGVIQRMIRGAEYTVDAIYDGNSRLIAVSPRRRLRASGVSTLGEVVIDGRLHAMAVELGRAMPLRYAINFQVIRDENAVDWLIELNPRLAGSALFSAMAGCDPFAATIALFLGNPWQGNPRPLKIWRYWHEWTPGDA